MTSIQIVATVFSWWIDAVVRAISEPLRGFRSVRRIEIVEQGEGDFTMHLLARAKGENSPDPCRIQIADGAFTPPSAEWATALRGSRVELVLLPKHFLFRAFELPGRAAEYLDGIIRTQIDRLTPWSAGQAAYHCSSPRALADERIAVTIVAASRAAVASLAGTISDAGAAAVEVSTVTEEAERVAVYGTRAAGHAEARFVRPALVFVLAVVGAIALVSNVASGFVIDHYDAQKQQIQRRITERLAILRGNSGGAAGSAIELLQRRKQATAASVIVIEALSALLPDHTYATELRIQGDKVQVIGLTRDAPSLIPLLEQSPHFSRAAFSAPTTHAANETGERFHIEATIKPHFGTGS
jgi:general secretion pathway protein L